MRCGRIPFFLASMAGSYVEGDGMVNVEKLDAAPEASKDIRADGHPSEF